MRIISQDGTIDVPYEISALSVGTIGSNASIYIRSKLLDEKPCVIAKYSSEEKALKAMEMVRKKYGDFITAQSKERYFAFNPPKIFQFPKDDEIEV